MIDANRSHPASGTHRTELPDDAGGAASAEGLELSLATRRRFSRVAWSRSPRTLVFAGSIISVLLVVIVAFLQFVLLPVTAIAIGIGIVVTLGAGGLVVRGVGELRDSPHWKSSGCFLCAAAYLGTASVALVNGVPLVFQQ